MIVRAAHQDVGEILQFLADMKNIGIEEADHINGDDGQFAIAGAEHDGSGHKRIVNLGGFAILAESGHEDGLFAQNGSDIGFAETDEQNGFW